MTHTKCCYFNLLLYLTSPLLAAGQSTYSTIYKYVHTGKSVHLSHPSGWQYNWWWWASHPCPFICLSYWKEGSVGSCSDLQAYDKIHFSCYCKLSILVPSVFLPVALPLYWLSQLGSSQQQIHCSY